MTGTFKPSMALIVALAVALVGNPGTTAAAQSLTARVVQVIDADRLMVAAPGGETMVVRVIGMESPGVRHRTMPAGVYKNEAVARASALALSRDVQLIGDGAADRAPESGEFPAERSVARHVVLPDGRDYAEVMIAEGYARYVPDPPFAADLMARYDAAEKAARSTRAGIWGREAPPRFEPNVIGASAEEVVKAVFVILIVGTCITFCALVGGCPSGS